MQASVKKPKFNHDLLIHPADLTTARALYPSLVDALFHPELIEYFKQFDDQAIDAKRKSRKLGTWAILLGGAAIAMAAIDVAIRVLSPGDVPILLIIGLIAAAFGLYSAALGAIGTLFGARKHEWLINRFMGERVRQFHFQSLIAQLPEILAMAGTGKDQEAKDRSEAEVRDEKDKHVEATATDSFLKDRHRRFVAFQAAFDELPREAKFSVTVGAGGEAGGWLCEPHNKLPALQNQPALQVFIEAYREIRIQHQLDYANYKLTSDPKIFSDMPRRQSELLTNVSKFGIQFVVVVHICVLLIIVISFLGRLLFGYQTGLDAAMVVTGIFAFAIIALAVVSLCAHAFAQGLQPEREVERYQQYGSAINSISADFDAAQDATEKIKIMWQMERAAFIEMRNFLITHHERSSFAM